MWSARVGSQTLSQWVPNILPPKSLLKIGIESWPHKHLVLWATGSHCEMVHLMSCCDISCVNDAFHGVSSHLHITLSSAQVLVLSDCASLTGSSITQIISFILLLTRLFPHVHGHLQTGTALTLSGSPSLAHYAVWWGGAHQEQMEALQAWGRLTWAPRQSPPASLSCSQSPTFNIEVTISPGRRKWRCKALKSSLPTGHSKQENSSHGFS